MSNCPECPGREGWKWEEMNRMLCRASMLTGPYAIQWEAGNKEWEVIEGHRQMAIFVAGPFDTAAKAMAKAERLATGQSKRPPVTR